MFVVYGDPEVNFLCVLVVLTCYSDSFTLNWCNDVMLHLMSHFILAYSNTTVSHLMSFIQICFEIKSNNTVILEKSAKDFLRFKIVYPKASSVEPVCDNVYVFIRTITFECLCKRELLCQSKIKSVFLGCKQTE